jgi:hypothetical protein
MSERIGENHYEEEREERIDVAKVCGIVGGEVPDVRDVGAKAAAEMNLSRAMRVLGNEESRKCAWKLME